MSIPLLVSRKQVSVLMVTSLALLISACAATPPSPEVKLSDNYRQGGGEGASATYGDWWQDLNDPVLNQLISRGLTSNHDARIAITRVEQARGGLMAQQSRLLPTLSATGSESDSRSKLPPPYKLGEPDVQASRIALDLSWEIDLFGAARAARRAARHDMLAAQAGVDGVRLLVSGEVARQYLTWRAARERLQLLDATLATLETTERLTRRRQSVGLASSFDVELVGGQYLDAQALRPSLHTLMMASEARLAVLIGDNPSQPIALLQDLPVRMSWPANAAVPTGQPVDLLARRPDLRVAEQQLAAVSERLREARLNYLPRFFLNAVLGSQRLNINDVALSPVRYSQVAAAFSAPLFAGGRLKAANLVQSAREREALLDYEKRILTAIEEVEVSLTALADERRRSDLLLGALSARQQALRQGDSLYRTGLIDLLQLQNLQRAALAAEQSLVESQLQVTLNRVRLHQALGGGWQGPTPKSVDESKPVAISVSVSSSLRSPL